MALGVSVVSASITDSSRAGVEGVRGDAATRGDLAGDLPFVRPKLAYRGETDGVDPDGVVLVALRGEVPEGDADVAGVCGTARSKGPEVAGEVASGRGDALGCRVAGFPTTLLAKPRLTKASSLVVELGLLLPTGERARSAERPNVAASGLGLGLGCLLELAGAGRSANLGEAGDVASLEPLEAGGRAERGEGLALLTRGEMGVRGPAA